MPSPETPLTDEEMLTSLTKFMYEEFRAWSRERSEDAPSRPGGLPAGWSYVSELPDVHGENWCLARRDAGGWAILARESTGRYRSTKLSWMGMTLSSLFTYSQQRSDSPDSVLSRAHHVRVREWLRGLLASMYDPCDPAEATEQVLLAMGGPLVVAPSADC